MFPTVEEYRTWCTSPDFAFCPVYRSRHGGNGVEVWLRIQYESWGVSALGAAT